MAIYLQATLISRNHLGFLLMNVFYWYYLLEDDLLVLLQPVHLAGHKMARPRDSVLLYLTSRMRTRESRNKMWASNFTNYCGQLSQSIVRLRLSISRSRINMSKLRQVQSDPTEEESICVMHGKVHFPLVHLHAAASSSPLRLSRASEGLTISNSSARRLSAVEAGPLRIAFQYLASCKSPLIQTKSQLCLGS